MYLVVTLRCRSKIIRNQKAVRWTHKLRKSSMTIYSAGFLLFITLLAVGYKSGGVSDNSDVASAKQSSYALTQTAQSQTSKISVDQLTAANAVTNLAESANLPAAGDLREATTTLFIKKELSQSDAEVISKPQIVQPTTSTERGVTNYTTQEGDSVTSVATKFNISAQTLRWANNMTVDTVDAGKTLTVPLVDGVLYTIKDGDTLQGIADKYKVDAERVLLYNDLEADKPLTKDVKIVLPNGDLPETERPGYVAPRAVTAPNGSYGSSTTVSSGRIQANASVGNRYAGGNCTWYAYERGVAAGMKIGSFWGNGSAWAYSARAAGFQVDQNPTAGSIFQTSSGGGGYGHVGFVESVDAQNIYVSDMNYAGLGVVTYRTIPRSALSGYNFIH